MPFRLLDEIALADAAFEATGNNLPGLFADAAEALLAVQVEDPASVRRLDSQPVEVSHAELDLLLYRFLQEIIYHKDTKRFLCHADDLDIAQDRAGSWHMQGSLRGEALDPERHEQRVDVKAVTLHRLAVAGKEGRWRATVVLDI
jgi:SHS2 domain-containing protein